MNGNDGLRSMLDKTGISRAELSRRLGVSSSWTSATLSRGCDLTTSTLARCANKLGWKLVLEAPDGTRVELDGARRADDSAGEAAGEDAAPQDDAEGEPTS